jgi:hypothetical protein
MGLNEQNSGWFDEEPEVDNNIEPEVIQDNDIEPNSDGELVKNIQFLGKGKDEGSADYSLLMSFDVPFFTTLKELGPLDAEDIKMYMLPIGVNWTAYSKRDSNEKDIYIRFTTGKIDFDIHERVRLDLIRSMVYRKSFDEFMKWLYDFRPFYQFLPNPIPMKMSNEEQFYSNVEKDIKLLNSHMEYHTNLYLKNRNK